MPILEPVIRPPSEADSFLLQVTSGCSADSCTFCGAYLGKPFHPKDEAEVFADIENARKYDPKIRRVFLMDGDALVLSNRRLIPILKKLQDAFPRLSRISSYANGFNLTARSDAELGELYESRLTLIYMGLESGSQCVLDRCKKKARVEEMVEGVRRAAKVGIKASVIVLLGLGGQENSTEHVRQTITALNGMQPRYLSFLSLMLIPGTELYAASRRGDFKVLKAKELLQESRDILAGLEMDGTIFRSNHASNYLPLEARLPQDKVKLLQVLDIALADKKMWRPEFMRGL